MGEGEDQSPGISVVILSIKSSIHFQEKEGKTLKNEMSIAKQTVSSRPDAESFSAYWGVSSHTRTLEEC